MLMKELFRKQRGIIVSDVIISILLILLFGGIITSLIVNIILETQIIKLNSQQIDFTTDVLEYVETLSYADVTEASLIDYINEKNLDYLSASSSTDTLTTTYKMAIDVQKYCEQEGNSDKLDIIKIITVTVKTELNNKEYNTTISCLKKEDMS